MSLQHAEAMAPPGDFSHRTPKPLPFELLQHTGIFFEEKLYTRALELLFSTLASGTYASNNVLVPLPQHLALAATFLVHPSTTTRAKSTEEKDAPDVALRLLRLYSAQVNPMEAKLNLAFSFTQSKLSRSGRRCHEEHDPTSELRHDETRLLNLELGKGDSLWSRAEDFWHAVGWAFNCSVLHPERWDRWQIWLHFMCDILIDDWTQREQTYEATQAQKKDNPQDGIPEGNGKRRGRGRQPLEDDLGVFRESLIFQYISAGVGHRNTRRIVRAIFADGSTASVNEFREVFDKELASLSAHKHGAKAKKREREVNIDKEEYGDYLTDDSDEDASVSGQSKPQSRAPTPLGDVSKGRRSKRTRRGTRNASDPSGAEPAPEAFDACRTALAHNSGGVSHMGGLDSLGLRKKFLGILSRVSDYLPKDFIKLGELYHFFVEQIRHMPLPIFQVFVNPFVAPELDDESQSTLCEFLLFNMIESSARTSHDNYLTDAKLEQCFLPYAAATASVVDDAKFSILLESLVTLLAGQNMLKLTPSLKSAVKAGIRRREDKESYRSQASRKKKSLEWCWLEESGQRLMFLVDLLEVQDG
ncbi:uncharacterized protein N7482_003709 [Penicillium canariense]|uniref:Uncharacterized protein n=1 Tax=Penicillium canariense TaxID=189055 RepID=A0A9W9LPK6_9EURO|nr:uncharacterized protein N7482_003709 [Penicillium canariense]KAJ5168115.1 hypothetical protein N7482_003709 [Penicillium canariense]